MIFMGLLIFLLGLNIAYFYYFSLLMKNLERYAGAYWTELGRPNGFSPNHVFIVLSNLYSSRMSAECSSASAKEALLMVRVLLPITMTITGAVFYFVAGFLQAA